MVEHCTPGWKVAGSIPAEAGRVLSYPGSTFCADSYFSIHATQVLLQFHVKARSHSAKSAGGRLELNTHTPS